MYLNHWAAEFWWSTIVQYLIPSSEKFMTVTVNSYSFGSLLPALVSLETIPCPYTLLCTFAFPPLPWGESQKHSSCWWSQMGFLKASLSPAQQITQFSFCHDKIKPELHIGTCSGQKPLISCGISCFKHFHLKSHCNLPVIPTTTFWSITLLRNSWRKLNWHRTTDVTHYRNNWSGKGTVCIQFIFILVCVS